MNTESRSLTISLWTTTVLFLFIYCPVSNATTEDGILGTWNNEEKDAQIEIFHCGGKYCGKIVWINKSLYSADESQSRVDVPRMDDNNPDPKLRSRPIIGLQIMSNFEYAGNYSWVGGKVYDPKSGRTYSGTITLVSGDCIELRGYVIFSFFGKTSFWTRVHL